MQKYILLTLTLTYCTTEQPPNSRVGTSSTTQTAGGSDSAQGTPESSNSRLGSKSAEKLATQQENSGSKTKVPLAKPAEVGAALEPIKVVDTAKRNTPDSRPPRQLLCEAGPGVVKSKDKDNFDAVFKSICLKSTTSSFFEDIVKSAYAGNGTPAVIVKTQATDSMFVTTLLFGYALRVPLASPKEFRDLNIYAKLSGKGIQSTNSKLVTTIADRDTFTGSGSVETVALKHRLLLARGAALYDNRVTEINNYLLDENSRDITLSTEHLVDKKNENYVAARGILFGFKEPKSNESLLVYINEFVVKNRIDPERLIGTMLDLSKESAKIIYQTAVKP